MNKLNLKLIPTAAALILAMAGTVNAAPTDALLPARAGDLVPQTLQAVTTASARTASTSLATATRPSLPGIDHRPVHVSWKLDASRPIATAPKPFDRTSREYWKDATAHELQGGLKLPSSAPGALISLSPEGRTFGQIDPNRLHVIHGGQDLVGSQAISNSANSTQLHQAGMMVTDGSVMMKLRPDLGPGPLTLKAGDAKGHYVVHVYEPQSSMVLHAQTDHDTIVSGQSVRLNVHLEDAGRNHAMDAVGGYLVAPDGHVSDLAYTRNADGSYHVDVTPDAAYADKRGLWEVHTFTSSTDGKGNTVLRDATSAFALSVTDARLDGTARVQTRGDGSIDITVGVQTVEGSRYAVSGVLYGHAANGSLQPMAYAQSANWLEAGSGVIDLSFDAGAIQGSGLKAPYELHDLKLVDQAHMGILERRAVALRFTP